MHPLAADRPPRSPRPGSACARGRPWRAGDRVQRHEADIVPVAGIAGARIAETDKQQHGGGFPNEAQAERISPRVRPVQWARRENRSGR